MLSTGYRIKCSSRNKFHRTCPSNHPFTARRTWEDVMQALSLFRYHVPRGFPVLRDLQGGIYQKQAVLSDPVILSRTHGPLAWRNHLVLLPACLRQLLSPALDASHPIQHFRLWYNDDQTVGAHSASSTQENSLMVLVEQAWC